MGGKNIDASPAVFGSAIVEFKEDVGASSNTSSAGVNCKNKNSPVKCM